MILSYVLTRSRFRVTRCLSFFICCWSVFLLCVFVLICVSVVCFCFCSLFKFFLCVLFVCVSYLFLGI